MEKSRERSKNFKDSEINLLLDLVKSKRQILECKKTDQVSSKGKEEAWGCLPTEFNNSSGIYYRDAKTLRSKYENLKKITKRKFAEEKSYVMGTGGGPPIKTEITQTDVKLKDLLGDMTVFGSESQFDSDARPNAVAQIVRPIDYVISDLDIESLPVVFEEEVQVHKNDEVLAAATTSSGSFCILQSPKKKPKIDDSAIGNENTSTIMKSLNMRDLRNKSSSPLKTSRKRKHILDTTVAGKKIVEVGNTKTVVLDLQKELYTKQIQFLEEEHKERMNFMKNDHEMKLQLLELKLQKNKLKISMLESN